MKPSILAATLAVVIGSTTAATAAENCNIYTSNSCFGVDWSTASQNDIDSIDLKA